MHGVEESREEDSEQGGNESIAVFYVTLFYAIFHTKGAYRALLNGMHAPMSSYNDLARLRSVGGQHLERCTTLLCVWAI